MMGERLAHAVAISLGTPPLKVRGLPLHRPSSLQPPKCSPVALARAMSEKPWSDSPNAPHISRLLYRADKENFAGDSVAAILYGGATYV